MFNLKYLVEFQNNLNSTVCSMTSNKKIFFKNRLHYAEYFLEIRFFCNIIMPIQKKNVQTVYLYLSIHRQLSVEKCSNLMHFEHILTNFSGYMSCKAEFTMSLQHLIEQIILKSVNKIIQLNRPEAFKLVSLHMIEEQYELPCSFVKKQLFFLIKMTFFFIKCLI